LVVVYASLGGGPGSGGSDVGGLPGKGFTGCSGAEPGLAGTRSGGRWGRDSFGRDAGWPGTGGVLVPMSYPPRYANA